MHQKIDRWGSKSIRELMTKLCMGKIKKLSNLVSCAEGIKGHKTDTKPTLNEVNIKEFGWPSYFFNRHEPIK
jgi:hypothetical protein